MYDAENVELKFSRLSRDHENFDRHSGEWLGAFWNTLGPHLVNNSHLMASFKCVKY